MCAADLHHCPFLAVVPASAFGHSSEEKPPPAQSTVVAADTSGRTVNDVVPRGSRTISGSFLGHMRWRATEEPGLSWPRYTNMFMAPRMDPVTATAIMCAAGVEPIEPYQNSGSPWRCRCKTCHRVVTPRLGNVRSGHAACAFCAKRAVKPDEAVAAMRAAHLEPMGPYPGAAEPWHCRCTVCGRESRPRYATVSRGAGCRYCGVERATWVTRLDPDEAAAIMRAAGLEPLEMYPGAGTPWRCRCSVCECEVTPRYTDVQKGHGGCKWCGWRTGAAKQRMRHEVASVTMVKNGLEPLEPYPGSGKQWRCRCLRCGAEVTPRYTNIRQGWGGCRTCWRAASSVRQRSPEAEAVETMRAAGLEPLEAYQNVMTPWRGQCRTCGRQVTPLLNNIRKGQGGCVWCAKCAVDPDDAADFMRTAGLEPLTAYPGRNAPWPCRCQRCDQIVSPRYGAVRNGSGCRYCNDTAIKPDAASALMNATGLAPLEPYPGSLRPWKCRCMKCGRTVQPCYSTIQRGGGGCRWCASGGFKSAEDATVYLITHFRYSATKVGITDAAGSRVHKHVQRGWHELITVRVPGELALTIEKDILDWWRTDLDLPMHLGKPEMPQGGWTETVDSTEIDLAATMRRIQVLARP